MYTACSLSDGNTEGSDTLSTSDDREVWEGIASVDNSDSRSNRTTADAEGSTDTASDDELFPQNHFDDDELFTFMGDEPEFALTPAEEAVASYAPSVRASMVLRNKRKHGAVIYAVGDVVTLSIPPKYCRSGDFSRFFCRVVDRPQHDLYQLRCESGLLKSLFPSNDLQAVPPEVASQYQRLITMTGSSVSLSLAAVARLASTGPPPPVVCRCKPQCTLARCSCIKANVRCSKRCHGSSHRVCQNSQLTGTASSPSVDDDSILDIE